MDMISLMKDTETYKPDYNSKGVAGGKADYKRYGFVCIDNFSKKCHVVPMANKDTDPVYDAFLECFKEMGHPQSVYSDDEGSFNSKKLQDYF